jgi:hypothetical protein
MMTAMAANNQKLVKDWIQYLKNLQIVALKSDPSTGKLSYNRPVTTNDVSHFLELKTDFSPEQISNAIHTVLSKNAQGQKRISNEPTPEKPGSDISTWMHNGMRPGHPVNQLPNEPEQTRNQDQGQQSNKLNYDPNSVSDIEYRDIPDKRDPQALPPPKQNEPKRKPRFKFRAKGINEDFEDNKGYELDEKDVEQIFSILLSNATSVPARPAARQTAPKKDSGAELNKLKQLIRDTMSDTQRKSLWRALNEI